MGYVARRARRKVLAGLGAALVAGLIVAGGAPGPMQAGPAQAGAVQAGGVPTVIAFGDSLTQGHGLAQGAGFVPQLQAWLAAHGHPVKIVNAGVSGDTTAGGLARIDWTLGTPAEAVIVELGGNDMLRGLPVAMVRKNLDGILKAIRAKGLPVLLIGQQAPPNYGAAYQQGFDAVFPVLAKEYDALLVPDFFAALKTKGETPQDMAAYMQPDGIHPSAAGVKLIVAAIGPKVAELLAKVK